MKLQAPVYGYKIFNPDWTCRDKQYTCPGEFKEDVKPMVCDRGMHFCPDLKDCFNCYGNNPNNHCAEVIALDEVVQDGNKCATNHLQIVREIPWDEVLKRVNQGKDCTGIFNTGNRNTGNRNTGDCNTGDRNTGNLNTGNRNTGNRNTGDRNTGNRNTGDWNTGDLNTGNRNTGDWNTGNRNTGDWNTGDCNTGDWNTGDWNTGNRNTGDRNTGNWNTGNRNTGDWNTGDWNSASFSNGVFCTKEPEILIFNKPSGMTFRQWRDSEACHLLNQIQFIPNVWVWDGDMTDEEKEAHPEYKTTGGFLKVLDTSDCCVRWWENLDEYQRRIIRSIPNFDAAIFKQITGIDAAKE